MMNGNKMMEKEPIQVIECPRDAMQGIGQFIPTKIKIQYLNALLKVGFHTLDFGSFVSPKAVPQMADTAEVLKGLELGDTCTPLLAIVANVRGAEDACRYPPIAFLGYPFSVSNTFQVRNTRKSISDSLPVVDQLQEMCTRHGKQLRIYLSMAFGNPYGDPWSSETVLEWAAYMVQKGVRYISLADTMGLADTKRTQELFTTLINGFPEVEWSAHFHAHPKDRIPMLEAAYASGCRTFETAIRGFGGCPFAEDHLVGNISTESLLAFCGQADISTSLHQSALKQAVEISGLVFG